MANREASVHVRNETGAIVRFQVLHQYTGEATEDSGWKEIAPGATQYMLNVHYRTGFFTTGVDNWIVNGIERRRVSAGFKLPEGLEKIEIGGEFFVDLRWSSGTGAFSDWKVHTLRSDDDGKVTTIIVRPTTVEFVSESGTSSTSWNPEYEIRFP